VCCKWACDVVSQVLVLEQVTSSITMLLITAQECVFGVSMQLIRLDVVVSMMLNWIFVLSVNGLSDLKSTNDWHWMECLILLQSDQTHKPELFSFAHSHFRTACQVFLWKFQTKPVPFHWHHMVTPARLYCQFPKSRVTDLTFMGQFSVIWYVITPVVWPSI